MDGPPHAAVLTTLRLDRDAESSRLQLDLVRRAFELIVPASQTNSHQTFARRLPRSAAAANRVRVSGA